MHNKFEKLSKEEKKFLTQLVIFGNQETKINLVIDIFANTDEHNTYLELFFKFAENEWIILHNNLYRISNEVETFIFNFFAPNTKNSRLTIEYFINLIIPPQNNRLPNDLEVLLLKTISRIQGVSSEMALLNDYYAQYLIYLKDTKTAIKFYTLAVDIQLKTSTVDVKLCNYYNHLAEAYLIDKQNDKALNFAFKSLHLIYNLPVKEHIVLVYVFTIISSVYFNTKKYDLSFEYSKKAVEAAKKHNYDNILLANLVYESSVCAQKAKQIEESIKLIKEASKIAEQIPEKQKYQKLFEKINFHKQYLALIKKLDNTIFKYAKWSYIIIAFCVLIILIVIGIIIL